MKKYFILFNDQEETFDALSNERAGLLIKAIFDYSNDKEPDTSPALALLFIPIRQQLDRNKSNYEERCRKNKENIEKRWKTATKPYDGIRMYTKYTNTKKNKKEQSNQPMLTKEETKATKIPWEVMDELERVAK